MKPIKFRSIEFTEGDITFSIDQEEKDLLTFHSKCMGDEVRFHSLTKDQAVALAESLLEIAETMESV